MTALARLILACIVMGLAAAGGLLAGFPDAADGPGRATRGWTPAEPPSSEAIDAYVARVAASGLFPEAALRAEPGPEAAEAVNLNTVDGLAEAMANPELAAVVREGSVWRIHFDAGAEGTVRRVVGDRLDDGWTIAEIGPTTIMLTRDGERRRIDVFPSVTDD